MGSNPQDHRGGKGAIVGEDPIVEHCRSPVRKGQTLSLKKKELHNGGITPIIRIPSTIKKSRKLPLSARDLAPSKQSILSLPTCTKAVSAPP